MSEAGGKEDLTRLLGRVREGEEGALDELMPQVYQELRSIARRQLGGQRNGRTLNTTALVHEAFLKLAASQLPDWNDRCHFYAVAATAMRQIVVDHARRHGSKKRGGDWQRVDLQVENLKVEEQAELLMDLDRALTRLSQLNQRLTRVVECRFFAGMSEVETAAALGITDRTVRRDWIKARAYLHRELGSTA
jgi:RNA polymerase sigma factor (TIGR02999 family)